MANIFRKFVAGVAAVAVVTSLSVPVMADETYVDWDFANDYTVETAKEEWYDSSEDVTYGAVLSVSNGVRFANAGDKRVQIGYKQFDSAISSTVLVAYDVMFNRTSTGNTDTSSFVLSQGTSVEDNGKPSDIIFQMDFATDTNNTTYTAKINDGSANPVIEGAVKGAWMHVENILDFDGKIVATTIKNEGGDQIYKGVSAFNSKSAASLGLVYMSVGKRGWSATLKNLSIIDSTIPDDVILDSAINALTISEGQMGMTVDGDVYHVKRDVALPDAPSGTTVEWSLSQAAKKDSGLWIETSFAAVEDGVLVVSPTDESANYFVKLRATVTVGELTDTKDFYFVVEQISAEEAAIKYDESFDGFATGTLVNVDANMQSNTDYSASNGMTFTCGSRGDGGGNAIGVIINANGTDKYMTLANSNYTGQGRRPVVTLTRKVNAENNIFIKADIRFAAADDDLLIYDSSSNTLKLNVPSDSYAGQWLNYTIVGGSGKAKILVKDADGKVLTYYTGDSALRGVATISLTDTNASTVDINNLFIADNTNTIANEDIVAAAKASLELDDLTYDSGVYTATSDFDLPDAPEDTTITWAVMQKAKNAAEWEASSFISASGTTATINPTSNIDDYDVKLVATITAGDVSDTKEFAIDLPNPMEEINGILAADFNVVSTTDTDADGKTITFDLKGGDMLKRDLILPIKYKSYKNTTVAWTSSDSDHVSISDDGIATVMTSDLNAHNVTLTAVITYKKGNVTYSSEPQKFDIKMGFEESDKTSADATMGKYKVRYDAAYDANFSTIPTYASSDITLPTSGYFGSTFIWSSSVPTVISNSGKFTKPSSAKTISMVASIISGSASAEKTFTISVAGSNTGSGGGGGGGSTSSTGTTNKGTGSGGIIYSSNTGAVAANTTSAADKVAQLQEEALAANDLFKDISQAAWARDEINGLAKAGVINGKTNELFAPNDTITRAEFAKMLMGTLGLASDAYTTSSFNDVSPDDWYFMYVESAYNLGIINGVGAGKFAPNALITRQDMAVMVARAAAIAGKDIAEVAEAKDFADAASIADYAKASIDTLVKGGIINGISDTEFAPLANATRAQAAKILYKFL